MAEVEKNLKLKDFDFAAPTFVLSEVVLAYLTDKYSTKCINWIARNVQNCLFVEFEQFQLGCPQNFKKISKKAKKREKLNFKK